MESLIVRNRTILSIYKIQELAREWNNIHCEPPLDDKEFHRQWNDAKRFIDRKNRQDEQSYGITAKNAVDDNENNDEQEEEDQEDYAAKLIEYYTLKTLTDTEEIWYYDSNYGIFMPDAEPIIKARIELDKGMPYMDKKMGR
jgi:hypothetical protein